MGTEANCEMRRHRSAGLFKRLLGFGRRRSRVMAATTGLALLVAVACGGAMDDASEEAPSEPDAPAETVPAVPQTSGVADNSVATRADHAQRSEDAVDLDFSTFQHGDFSLADVEGKAVVINFWFPSCPPCRAELPDIQASHETHKGDDVQFLGVQLIGLDSAEEGDEFLRELGITYPNGSDATSSIIRDFKVTGFPTTVFLDRSHEVSRKWTGILDETRIEEEIAEALGAGSSG